MGESFQSLKTNLKLQNVPCQWCQAPLQLGEDAAVCSSCQTAHHETCWQTQGGCGQPGCANAPLQQLAPPTAGGPAYGAAPSGAPPPGTPQLPPGKVQCPACNNVTDASEGICLFCDHIISPDGIYHGPKENAPGAVASLVLGIVGLFCCGIIVGFVAISKANSAKALIATNPRYGGEGLATAGYILGVIDIVLSIVMIIVRIAGMAGNTGDPGGF